MLKMEFKFKYTMLETNVSPILASLFQKKLRKIKENLRLNFGKIKKLEAQAKLWFPYKRNVYGRVSPSLIP